MGKPWQWAGGCLLLFLAAILAYVAVDRGSSPDESLATLQKMGIPTSREVLKTLGPHGKADAEKEYERFVWGWNSASSETRSAYKALNTWDFTSDPRTMEQSANLLRELYDPLFSATQLPQWNITQPGFDDRYRTSVDNATAVVPLKMAFADGMTGNLKMGLFELQCKERLLTQESANPYSIVRSRREIFRVYRYLIQEHRSDPVALQQIADSLAAIRPQPDARLLTMEFAVYDKEIYDDPKLFIAVSKNPGAWEQFRDRWIEPGRVRGYAARDIQMWPLVFQQMPNSPVLWDKAREVIRAVVLKEKGSRNRYGSVPSQLAYAMWNCDEIGTDAADRSLLIASCKLLMAQAKTGSLPATLPDYGVDSVDPFTNAPFRYMPTSKGFTIYSLGLNRKDDHATLKARGMADIVETF